MKRIKTFVFFCALAVANLAWGSMTDAESALRYQKASNLCRAYTSTGLGTRVLTTLQTTGQNLYQGAKTAVSLQGFGLSTATKELIESDEYFQALRECFGSYSDHRLKWDSLTLMLIVSDATGQSLTYVGSYLAATRVLRLAFSVLRFAGLGRATGALSLGVAGKISYDAYRAQRELLDPEFAEQVSKDEIRSQKIPELDQSYRELLGDISRALKAEQTKPLELRDAGKMAKLQELHSRSLREYQDRRQELAAAAQ